MLEKLRIKITILASLIVTAYAYLYKIDFLKTGYTLIVTIVVFYFLGGFIEIFLQNQFKKIEEEKKLAEENILQEANEQEEIYEQENEDIENIDMEENNIGNIQ
nr:hypothetical protein [uncultured Tyzzerella sp.]